MLYNLYSICFIIPFIRVCSFNFRKVIFPLFSDSPINFNKRINSTIQLHLIKDLDYIFSMNVKNTLCHQI